MSAARRPGTNAAATPTSAVTAAMASSATGSMLGRYTEMLADPDVARSRRCAQREHRRAPRGRDRCPCQPRPAPPRLAQCSTPPADCARRAPCGCRSHATAARRQTRRRRRDRCWPAPDRGRRGRRETWRPPSAPPATSSSSCAIVCAVITGSVTSTARSSRCIAATRRRRITRRPRDDRRRQRAGLRVRAVERRRDRIEDVVVEVAGAGIAHDADHLGPRVRIVLQPESPADGVHRAEVLPRHPLGDHRDARRVRAVACVERAAVQERDAQRVEEARSRRRSLTASTSDPCLTGGAVNDDRHAS